MKNTSPKTPAAQGFSIITGDRDALLKTLYEAPHTLEQGVYEKLMESLENILTFDERLVIMKRRVELTPYDDPLEKRTLLAILDGNDSEQKHLIGVLARRNALGLKVISDSAPASPPQPL